MEKPLTLQAMAALEVIGLAGPVMVTSPDVFHELVDGGYAQMRREGLVLTSKGRAVLGLNPRPIGTA